MKKQFKQGYFIKFYLLPISMLWLTGLVFLFAKGYKNSFLILNSYHSAWLDYPMLVLTMFGNAGFMGFVLIFILIKKQPYQLTLLLIALIVSGILAQLLKDNAYDNWSRPPQVFKEQVHTVAKYILYYHSFPSGHSITVAAVFTMLAYFRREHKTEIIFYATLCPLIAYTRIYLGVHFLGDAIFGILLGFTCSFLILFLIKPFEIEVKSWLIKLLRITSIIAAVIILIDFFRQYI